MSPNSIEFICDGGAGQSMVVDTDMKLQSMISLCFVKQQNCSVFSLQFVKETPMMHLLLSEDLLNLKFSLMLWPFVRQ